MDLWLNAPTDVAGLPEMPASDKDVELKRVIGFLNNC